MRDDSLSLALLSSCLLHIAVIVVTSMTMQKTHLRREGFLPISLVVVPQMETPPVQKEATLPKLEKTREIRAVVKGKNLTPAKKEPARSVETKPSAPVKMNTPPIPAPGICPVKEMPE